MIVEIEEETRDFLTIYNKDFREKSTRKREPYIAPPNYPAPLNVLNGPYKKYLNTRRKNSSLPLNERSEDPQGALERFREKYPHLSKFLPETVPNEETIERKEMETMLSTYQLDYLKNFVEEVSRRRRAILPEDWIISETIQRKSYRNPWDIASEKLLQPKRKEKPPDNLKPNPKEREILRVRTGVSEYNGTIDATGSKVMQECLLGIPLAHEPQIYAKRPDSPKSECSVILESKRPMLPSKIF